MLRWRGWLRITPGLPTFCFPLCCRGRSVDWLPGTELATFLQICCCSQAGRLRELRVSVSPQPPNPEIHGSLMPSPFPPHPNCHQVLSMLLPKRLCVSVHCHFYNFSSDCHPLFNRFNLPLPPHWAPGLSFAPVQPTRHIVATFRRPLIQTHTPSLATPCPEPFRVSHLIHMCSKTLLKSIKRE